MDKIKRKECSSYKKVQGSAERPGQVALMGIEDQLKKVIPGLSALALSAL